MRETRARYWLCHRCTGYVPIALVYCPRCADTRVPGCEDCFVSGNACPTHGDPTQPAPRGVLP